MQEKEIGEVLKQTMRHDGLKRCYPEKKPCRIDETTQCAKKFISVH